MQENTRKARELVGAAFNLRNSLRYWQGMDYAASSWSMAPNPVGGDTVSMNDFGPARHSFDLEAEGREYVALDFTLWGDYIGSDVGRSNERSLRRDYPDTFVEASGFPGAYELYLPADAEIDEYLFNALIELADQYPLYDEEDHSALEMELAEQAWDDYLQYDINSDLEKRGIDHTIVDMDAVRERFYELTMDANEYPYLESAVSVVFPCYDETLDKIAEELKASV